MGWKIVDGGRKILHGGANEAFHTEVNLYPRRGRAFVLLTNEGHQVDHFVSARQLTDSVEAIVLCQAPPPVSRGWSVRWPGWALGFFVLILIAMHARNFVAFARLARARPADERRAGAAFAVAISFIIPIVILIIVFSQIQAFYGTRFNLLTSAAYFRLGLPDVFILLLIGTLPDFIQGGLKLAWTVTRR